MGINGFCVELEITVTPCSTTGRRLNELLPNVYDEFLLPKGQKFKVNKVTINKDDKEIPITVSVETIS